MMQDQKTSSVNKIPLLGDIPLIGKLLFSYNTTSKTKTELLIFLTPHVATRAGCCSSRWERMRCTACV